MTTKGFVFVVAMSTGFFVSRTAAVTKKLFLRRHFRKKRHPPVIERRRLYDGCFFPFSSVLIVLFFFIQNRFITLNAVTMHSAQNRTPEQRFSRLSLRSILFTCENQVQAPILPPKREESVAGRNFVRLRTAIGKKRRSSRQATKLARILLSLSRRTAGLNNSETKSINRLFHN